MHINLNKKNEGEMVFSWKEVWILIKKRKLTMNVPTLEKVILTLCQTREYISKKDKDVK